MALHGEIKVNGDVVVVWGAQRVQGSAHSDSVNMYSCVVFRLSPAMEWAGMIQHRYGDGAEVLVKLLMEQATDFFRVTRVPVQGPGYER